jgi:hypothetical protein
MVKGFVVKRIWQFVLCTKRHWIVEATARYRTKIVINVILPEFFHLLRQQAQKIPLMITQVSTKNNRDLPQRLFLRCELMQPAIYHSPPTMTTLAGDPGYGLARIWPHLLAR